MSERLTESAEHVGRAALAASSAAGKLSERKSEIRAILAASFDGTLANRHLSKAESDTVGLLAIFAHGHLAVGSFDVMVERYNALSDEQKRMFEEDE